tara:strand:- start:38 stop:304 length:267 start_codon:yes stop_codon:yes gene_type:complete
MINTEPKKISNTYIQDKILELLLFSNYANTDDNKEILKRGWHYENDKQFIQEDLEWMLEWYDKLGKKIKEVENIGKIIPGYSFKKRNK